jgi:hypothetical protein
VDYLWEESGLNRWSPRERSRNWFNVRRSILHAAFDKEAKGAGLMELVYLPEPFFVEKKDEISARRTAAINTRCGDKGKYMIMIGEVKTFAETRFGHKAVIKHLPDFPLMLNEDLFRRVEKRYERDLEIWSAHDSVHLIIVATFGLSLSGLATAQEMALMTVNQNWIPFLGKQEFEYIEKVTRDRRSFMKSLRYNLPSTKPIANLVLTDTTPRATAVYIVPAGVGETYYAELDALIAESNFEKEIVEAVKDEPLAGPANSNTPGSQKPPTNKYGVLKQEHISAVVSNDEADE